MNELNDWLLDCLTAIDWLRLYDSATTAKKENTEIQPTKFLQSCKIDFKMMHITLKTQQKILPAYQKHTQWKLGLHYHSSFSAKK